MQAAQLLAHSFPVVIKGGRSILSMLASLALALMLVAGARAQTGSEDEDVVVPSRAEEAEPAKSVITGKAVYDDTDRPVRRASIMLIDLVNTQQSPEKFSTATDNDGKFRIKNVPAGSYIVMVDAPGVLTGARQATDFLLPGQQN
jgi:hypothetical protein